jgi:hypothetical protein
MAAWGAACADGGAVVVGPMGPDVPDALDPGPAVPDDGGEPDSLVPDATDRDLPAQRDVEPGTLVTTPHIPPMSFRFEDGGQTNGVRRIDVVARDFPDVFGVALRVEFDAAALAFEGADLAPIFGEEGSGAIYRQAEVRPGSVTLGLSHLSFLGEAPLEGDRVVATLSLRPLTDAACELTFFAPRSLVLTRRLESLSVSYLPATLHP